MNRMGWVIALAGAWALVVLAVVGATTQGGTHNPDCIAGDYLSANGWCVPDPQPADAPGTGVAVVLVAGTSVGPLGIEPRTEGL